MGKYNKKNVEKNKKVEEKEGLSLSYNKEELIEKFPNLTKELIEKQSMVNINLIKCKIEEDFNEESQKSNDPYPEELYNPGVVDFIRRCTKIEDAVDILDYLLGRNEISKEEYNKYKKIIIQEGGLQKLITEGGGLKKPGYYMKKYYKKTSQNQKLNSNDN